MKREYVKPPGAIRTASFEVHKGGKANVRNKSS